MSDQPKHTGDMARLLPFTNEHDEVEVIALGDVGPLIVASRQSVAALTDRLGVMREALEKALPLLAEYGMDLTDDGADDLAAEAAEAHRIGSLAIALQSDRTNHE